MKVGASPSTRRTTHRRTTYRFREGIAPCCGDLAIAATAITARPVLADLELQPARDDEDDDDVHIEDMMYVALSETGRGSSERAKRSRGRERRRIENDYDFAHSLHSTIEIV